MISLLSRLWKHPPSQPSSVDIKSYRGPPSPYRHYTKSSYHWDENTPKYAHDASKIWLKIILFRMKFCRCCPKTKSRKAMEQQNFFLITQLAGESIMLKRTNSAIPKCFLFIVHNHIVLIYFKTRTKGPISLPPKSLDQNLLISFSNSFFLLIWLWSKLVKQVSQFDWRGLDKQWNSDLSPPLSQALYKWWWQCGWW